MRGLAWVALVWISTAPLFAADRPPGPLTAAEERTLKPGDNFKECDACPEMVVVPAGSFMMGSPATEQGRLDNEGPQRKVIIAKPFAAGKYEVTFDEWYACVAAGDCKHAPTNPPWRSGRHPVANVSWTDITKQYLPWLSRKTGKVYRLLSEAEWEYATRAGTTTPYSTGQTITFEQARIDGLAGGTSRSYSRDGTIDVGSFRPNAFGLYDMHGNVWEWVQDHFQDSYVGTPVDGSAVEPSFFASRFELIFRVQRGGSWASPLVGARSAMRRKRMGDEIQRDWDAGFRVARTL
jgi:formylglycine-generating enzyme required for sulfatase activity